MADLYESIKILREACKNPRAKLDQYLSEGKKVVGCFPPYTPEELVHASGMIPMGLWGGRTELALAKSHHPGRLRYTALYDPELAFRRVVHSDDPHRVSAEPRLPGQCGLSDQRI